MHAIVFSPEAEQVRAFFGDVLGLSPVDAGGGWLIFACLPPSSPSIQLTAAATMSFTSCVTTFTPRLPN